MNERGYVGKYEYVFDIYTKAYDFHGSHVKFLSSQDLWAFYEAKNKGANRKWIPIYFLVEYFIQHHQHGHFVLDEVPFLLPRGKLKINQCIIETNFLNFISKLLQTHQFH